MKETKTYHAVYDQSGNIRSISIVTSNIGAREMMTPEPGCSVSPVNLQELKIPAELKLVTDEDADRLRELMKHYRVDTSSVGTLIKKSANQR